jgi:hypothetical protein
MPPAKPGSVALHFSSCLPLRAHASPTPAARAGAGVARRRKGRGEERPKQNRGRWQGYYCPGRAEG